MEPDAAAIEAMKALAAPSEGHARLEPMVGSWDTVTRMWMGPGDPIETTGSVEKAWVLGGRFLELRLKGVGPFGEPYEGLGMQGFNNVSRRYEGTWVSDGGTWISHYTGEVSDDGTVFEYEGVDTDPTGEHGERPFAMKHTIDGPDRHTLTYYFVGPDGERFKAFEIEHTRRA